jgi:hypothetical protein
VTQLLFWALEDLHKQEPGAPLYVVPVAIKYRFLRDMRPALLASMARLEQALALPGPPPDEPYPRLRRIGAAVLTAMERDYGLKCSEDAASGGDMNGRIAAVKEALMHRVASALHLPLREQGTISQRMRLLINALHAVTSDQAPLHSPYEGRLRAAQRARVAPLLHDLDRLANLIAIRDGYVSALPTAERMADTLRRLETEVLGRAVCAGPRSCRLRVGEPLDLAGFASAYAVDKRATVQMVTEEMEARVQSLLDEMATG